MGGVLFRDLLQQPSYRPRRGDPALGVGGVECGLRPLDPLRQATLAAMDQAGAPGPLDAEGGDQSVEKSA
jgi:hypothetical protein